MNRHTSALLLSLLLLNLSNAQAFDLKGTLKDAIKKQTETAPNASNANGSSTDTGTNTSTEQPNSSSNANIAGINLSDPSQEDEIKIGREIAGNILGASPLVKDAGLQKYVNQVGRWVASQSERPDLPWHFGVIESDDINAFAAPGGYIVITKGLYKKLEDESQLAGVLGHEIGHVVKKHHIKVLQKSQLLNLGANLLGSSLGKNNQSIQALIGHGAEISARGLDKDAEFEADRVGLTLSTRSGYEPYGLVDILQILSLSNKNDSSVALLYKTHPSPDDRLEKLADAAGTKLDKIKDGKLLGKRLYKLK